MAAAERTVEAGLNGVELMMYGHFLDSFCTPFWNHRTDEFGGSYENRMRYPLQAVSEIRSAVPDSFLLGARISFDEKREPGLGPDEALTVTADVVAAGSTSLVSLRARLKPTPGWRG